MPQRDRDGGRGAVAHGAREPTARTDRTARVSRAAARVRTRLVFVVLDGAVTVAAYGVGEVVFLRDRAPAHYWHRLVWFLVLALVVQLVLNRFLGLYGRIWRHAGIEEARNIVVACGITAVLLLMLQPLAHVVHVGAVPVQVVPLEFVLVTVGIGILRFHSRLLGWQRSTRGMGMRVAVIGSRDNGASVVREMLRSPMAGLYPVAVFDDDPRSHGLSLMGVPVIGSVDDIPRAVPRLHIQQLLLAVTSPSSTLVDRCLRSAEAAGVTLKIVPGVRELVGAGRPAAGGVRAAREPRIEDLLGRRQVDTDLEAVSRALHGRRVLVTGAGGSIGSEICRQVASFGPELLVLLDRDETHLHDAAARVTGPVRQALVDITDPAAVRRAFERYSPEVVFHAAAHKHVPILETHVLEAVTTNVFGSAHVLDEAVRAGVQRFVLISTDKAVRPVSVMGATKRVGEHLLVASGDGGAPYCAVRFGNVLGSRGSVIPTFRRQIAAGGPVTVTDPEMTRFFMSVEEAVQLVLQAAVLADGGDIFMLEMGRAVRILDLAQRMIRLSGYTPGADIAIRITGRRPGERLHEELQAPSEERLPTAHPAIHRLLPEVVGRQRLQRGLAQLREALAAQDDDRARQVLFELAGDPEDANDSTGAPLPVRTTGRAVTPVRTTASHKAGARVAGGASAQLVGGKAP